MVNHLKFVFLCLPFFFVSCSSNQVSKWLMKPKSTDQGKIPAADKRVSILEFEKKIQFDLENHQIVVDFPEPNHNLDWPLAWRDQSHYQGHLFAGIDQTVWKEKIFDQKRAVRFNAQPVIQNEKIFVFDTYQSIKSIHAKTGELIWKANIYNQKKHAEKTVGGGIGVHQDAVLVSTGIGSIIRLNAQNGEEVWRKEFGKPFKSSPIIADQRVYVISNDNEIFALSLDTGENLWSWSALPETARVMSAPAVAVKNEVVLAPFSSGELIALRAETGSVLWSDELLRIGRLSPLASINDIPGAPVIDNNIAYVMNQSGLLVALNIKNGQRLWVQSIGGANTPWLAGEYVFVISEDAKLVCFNKHDGSVIWMYELQQFKNMKKRKNKVSWVGPVIINGHVLAVSSEGEIVLLSVKTGEFVKSISIKQPVYTQPVIADQIIYFLTGNGSLIAMQ